MQSVKNRVMSCAQFRKKQRGMAALSVTMTILIIITIITLFSARIIVTDAKIAQNQFDAAQAFNASQAGMDYVAGYLNISSSMSSQITNGQTFNGTLSDGTKYAATLTFLSNSTKVSVKSVGTSADGLGTRTTTASFFQYSSGGALDIPLTSVGRVSITGSQTVENTIQGLQSTTITGSTMSITGGAATYYVNGAGVRTLGSQPSWGVGIRADVTQNSATVGALNTSTALENAYLGQTIASYQSPAGSQAYSFTRSQTFGTYNNTLLLGKTGLIYLNMNGNAVTFQQLTLGSTSSPVTLVINNASLITINYPSSSGVPLVYGAIFTNSPITLRSNAVVKGVVFSSYFSTSNANPAVYIQSAGYISGLVVAGNGGSSVGGYRASGGGSLVYDSTFANLLKGSSAKSSGSGGGGGSGSGYGMVSGSWRDF